MGTNLPRQLLTVEFQPVTNTLVVPRRRTNITGARAALNGYQKGHCFYCYTPIDIASGSTLTCHVDHLFPWAAGPVIGGAPVDGVWNLVLACAHCNSWHEKSNRPPHMRYVERLNIRNEFLIASYHPLRPTLIAQTGASVPERSATLKRALDQVSVGGARAACGSRPKSWTRRSDGTPNLSQVKHGKLVRDRIPEIIRSTGRTPEVRALEGDELLDALLSKLEEETRELRTARHSQRVEEPPDTS